MTFRALSGKEKETFSANGDFQPPWPPTLPFLCHVPLPWIGNPFVFQHHIRLNFFGRRDLKPGLRLGPQLSTAIILQCRVYILGNQYDKARSLARTDPTLQQYVEQQHTQYLLRDKNAEALANIGSATEAIEIYAQQGDWGRVHTLAEQSGPQSVIKYSIR